MEVVRFKVIFLGDRNVGKTSLALLHRSGTVSDSPSATIGFETYKKRVSLKTGTHALVDLWDTAGMERFRESILPKFYDTNGVILVYDITNEESFIHLGSWMQEIANNCKTQFVKGALIGNKADTGHERKVTTERGLEFAREHKMLFEELSAKNPGDAKRLNLLVQSLAEELHEAWKGDQSIRCTSEEHFSATSIIEPKLESGTTSSRRAWRKRCNC
ncbi:hypothetical protein EMCRGX_G033657 [Ephydatia muelleri]|eukprot:Em0022g537a